MSGSGIRDPQIDSQQSFDDDSEVFRIPDLGSRSRRSDAPDPGSRHAKDPHMPADLLEFEEPIGVLLKEIEALSMLPRTPGARAVDRNACRNAPTRFEPSSTPTSRPGSAFSSPAIPTAPTRSTTWSGCSPASTSCTAIAGSPTITPSSAASPTIEDSQVAVVGHQKGARHQTEDLPQLRLRAPRGLPQGAAGDAARREVPAGRSWCSSTLRRRTRASNPRSAASLRPSPSTCAR